MNEEYLGFVYEWTNLIDGMRYIGVHKGKIDDGYIGGGVRFTNAWKKYGKENFTREILYLEYESLEKLYQKEFDIINEYNAVEDTGYYNLMNYDPKFTKWITGAKCRPLSDETKRKISEGNKGNKWTEESKRRLSESTKGKKLTPEHCANISAGQKGRKISEEQKEQLRVFHTGRRPTQETRQKMSENSFIRGKKFYNKDGLETMFFEGQEPEGWIIGRLEHRKLPTGEGTIIINNGEINKRWEKDQEIPEGWVKGALRNCLGEDNPFYGKHHSEETKQLLSEQRKGQNTGEDNPFYGKKHSEETKAKMRAAWDKKRKLKNNE